MGSFYSRPASNEQRPEQTLNPEEEEEEEEHKEEEDEDEEEDEERAHQTALAELISHFSRFPQEIASAVIFLPHEELGSHNYSRYLVAEALRNVIPLCMENRQMLHTICTTGLPEVLLDIVALDPFVYAWHDKSSRDYHPKLGVSVSSNLCLVLTLTLR